MGGGINGRTGCRGRGEVGGKEPWEPDGLSFSHLVFLLPKYVHVTTSMKS